MPEQNGTKITIEIDVPALADILEAGCPVPIAPKGIAWSMSCLGKVRRLKGVYVIHHDHKVKYVGKTDGPTMNFGTRLRREFQQSASGDKHIYPKLSVLQVPPNIMVTCIPTDEIKRRIKFSGHAPRPDHLVTVFEIAMILHLDPELQQQFIERHATQITRAGKAAQVMSMLQSEH